MCIVAIRISREIFARLKNFLTYRIAATLQLLVFFFIAVFSLPPQAPPHRGIGGRGLYSLVVFAS